MVLEKHKLLHIINIDIRVVSRVTEHIPFVICVKTT